MSGRQRYASHRAEELRLSFDQGFAHAPETNEAAFQDFLAIGLGASAYVLQLNEVSGLYIKKKITRVPSRVQGLLGISGFRGSILPVYDLAVLLGHAPLEYPRWIAVAGNTGIAIAFERFDGHLRIPQDSIALNTTANADSQHARHLVQTPGGIRAVISLPSALAKITEPQN